MPYRLVGLGLWLLFFLIISRKDWKALYPALVFTALLGTVADIYGVMYKQWEYIGPTTGGISLWSDLGIAPPQGGFAIYLHRRFPRWSWLNWLFWISANAVGEWLFVHWGLIRYHQWSSLKATLFYFPFFALIYLQERWWKGDEGGAFY
ncbi:MAG TPA: hypothetical protein DDW93_10380 [Firmicutes bacterium]|nr:hypothetical protein [Bacillota bacterium]HBK70028.1 hypothetical protein [Bacillota bacterium]